MGDLKKTIAVTKCWLDKFVLALNLCPFAHHPFKQNRIRYTVTQVTSEITLLEILQQELVFLHETPAEQVETTLLIHPKVLQDFFEYNAFLDVVDDLLVQLDLVGIIQVASFHPGYLFAGTTSDDAENYTNRSPYPMLHLIREESLEKGIANYPDSEKIPERNIEKMNELGKSELELMIADCTDIN